MHQIYSESLAFVQESVGVDYLPQEWIRGTAPKMNVQANARGKARLDKGLTRMNADRSTDLKSKRG